MAVPRRIQVNEFLHVKRLQILEQRRLEYDYVFVTLECKEHQVEVE